MIIQSALPRELYALGRGGVPVTTIGLAHLPPWKNRMTSLSVDRFSRACAAGQAVYVGFFTDELKERFVAQGIPEAHAVRIPNIFLTPAAASPIADAPSGRPTISYAGDARVEKGFGLLGDVVERLRDLADFRIQCTLPAGPVDPSVARAVAQLEALEGAGVELVRGFLGQEQYASLIANSDAVLMPYVPDCYQAGRVSGILPEAWASGTPVVVSDGWWGADLVHLHGGGVVFRYGDIDDLAEAVERLVGQREAMADSARTASVSLGVESSADQAARALLRWSESLTGTSSCDSPA